MSPEDAPTNSNTSRDGTRCLKAGVTRMWATLTTSEAANASETRYRATSAKMAADLIDKAQRKAREGKPGVRPAPDEGSIFGD
jgi:hypothetical protein